MTVNLWSPTAANNDDIDPTINWAEGQAPSTVNDSSRAMMAAMAKWRDDISGNVVTGGSSTAYTLTSSQSLTPLVDGYTITARIHTANGASPTLNVDSTGAKAIRVATGTAVATGTLLAGSVHRFTYDSGDNCWYLHGRFFTAAATLDAAGIMMLFQQTAAPTGWTKETTHNNKALRVVTGAAGSGGSVAFTTAFASQTPSGTVGGTALTLAQIPSHGHPWRESDTSSTLTGSGGFVKSTVSSSTETAFNGAPTDTNGQAIGGSGGDGSHTHSFAGNAINLAVSYVDLILASKD